MDTWKKIIREKLQGIGQIWANKNTALIYDSYNLEKTLKGYKIGKSLVETGSWYTGNFSYNAAFGGVVGLGGWNASHAVINKIADASYSWISVYGGIDMGVPISMYNVQNTMWISSEGIGTDEITTAGVRTHKNSNETTNHLAIGNLIYGVGSPIMTYDVIYNTLKNSSMNESYVGIGRCRGFEFIIVYTDFSNSSCFSLYKFDFLRFSKSLPLATFTNLYPLTPDPYGRFLGMYDDKIYFCLITEPTKIELIEYNLSSYKTVGSIIIDNLNSGSTLQGSTDHVNFYNWGGKLYFAIYYKDAWGALAFRLYSWDGSGIVCECGNIMTIDYTYIPITGGLIGSPASRCVMGLTESGFKINESKYAYVDIDPVNGELIDSIYRFDSMKKVRLDSICLNCEPLPAGTAIKVWYKKDLVNSWTQLGDTISTTGIITSNLKFPVSTTATFLQVKIELISNATQTLSPEFLNYILYYNDQGFI